MIKLQENSSELELGISVEQEHGNTFKWLQEFVEKNGIFPEGRAFFERIATEHLEEDPQYYSKLKTLGL